MNALRIPTPKAAMVIPSMSWWGLRTRMARSLNVPGSPSSALTQRYLGPAPPWGANEHFRPAGKPGAPPAVAGHRPMIDTVDLKARRMVAMAQTLDRDQGDPAVGRRPVRPDMKSLFQEADDVLRPR